MREHRINRVLPLEIEDYRDARWRRENTRCVETAVQAEEFIERVGFAACLTDVRQPGPSLYVAVCGRRDAIMPRNVQKDPESAHTWIVALFNIERIAKAFEISLPELLRGI
jgi:hypothetical protein